MKEARCIAVFGAGIIGASAYTFTDSFWFSATEGVVWASASFFTAVVFWAMLKWDAAADEKNHWRWIILISYLIGCSIGVHLLNLLTIPAMVFIYYFRKHTPTRKGIIYTFFIALALTGFVMKVIIPWSLKLDGYFELFFVNTVGLPFNSGTIIYFALLIGGIIWGLRYTISHKKEIAQVIILSVMFLLIGYSSFLILVIRANAKTVINENSPDNAMSLVAYLGREQYGDWPLNIRSIL